MRLPRSWWSARGAPASTGSRRSAWTTPRSRGRSRSPTRTRRSSRSSGVSRRRHRDHALLLGAGPTRRVRRARMAVLVRRQRDLSKGNGAAGRCARGAGRSPAGRDRRPVPLAAAASRKAERAGERRQDRGVRGGASRCAVPRAGGDGRAQRRARLRVVSEPPPAGAAPRQASLRRLREFGIRPNRELGQNFLIDDNILGVIGKTAELDPGDVVLEVGGGLGVLSEYLAPRVAHLHVVEVDRGLAPALEDALGPFENATLHLADAVRLDLAALDPAPTKIVANLPYGVAATVVLKSIDELPGATVWVAMVQREVGERLAAPPRPKANGATSVL